MSINLLAWRENRQRRQFKKHLVILIIIWFFIAIGIGVFRYYLNLCKEKYQIKHQNLAAKVQLTGLTKDFQQLQNQYQITLQQISLCKEIKNQKKIFWQAMTALQDKLPDETHLDSISWQKTGFQFQGTSKTSEQVNFLMNLLENLSLFDNISLDSIHQNDQSKLT